MAEFDDDWLLKWIEDLLKDNKAGQIDATKLTDIIADAVKESLLAMAKGIAKNLKESSHFMVTEHRHIRNEFKSRLQRRWFEAFDVLEMIIVGLSELGEEMNKDLRQRARPGEIHLVEALTRIHARAIRISYEILCLLHNGFSDGAFARWRSLHELAVHAIFLAQHGAELAKLFLEYADIERYLEAELYQEHASQLGYESLTANEFSEIRERRNQLVAMYSEDFAKAYGWTLNVLPKKKRNFKGIEDSVDLSRFRPFYAMASRSLHSTPKGLFWDLGLMDLQAYQLLLAGASNYGMADPGQNTAISLIQITSTLVLLDPSVTRLAALEATRILFDEMAQKFVDIQKEIERDEKER